MLLKLKIQSKTVISDRFKKLREIQFLLPSFQHFVRIKKKAIAFKSFMWQVLVKLMEKQLELIHLSLLL